MHTVKRGILVLDSKGNQMSKTAITTMTVIAAASGATVHFVPMPYEPLVEVALSLLFAHFGVTFAKPKAVA